jgi:flavorubredoxin
MDFPIRFLDTQTIAPETFLIRQLGGEGHIPDLVHLNTLVIRGEQPVIVDTGISLTRDEWLQHAFALVEPDEVRWIFISHDDPDHTGALHALLEACPNAKVVVTWFAFVRMGVDNPIPLERIHIANPGDALDVGDRTLQAIVPPAFDNPTTRGLFDPTTGVYWGSDAFAASVPHEVESADDLELDDYRERFLVEQRMISPWHQWLDPSRYAALIDQSRSIGVTAAVGAHGPVARGRSLNAAYRCFAELPHLDGAQLLGQSDLELMLSALAPA